MANDPGLTLGLGLFLIVGTLTAYGIYLGFGPPSKQLEDPFDNHED